MATKKEEALKRILKKLPVDQPSPNFTAMVMKEVEADMQDLAVIAPELKSLLERSGIETPPIEFAYSVMAHVKGLEHQQTYKPVISKKVWIAVAAVMILFMCWGVINKQPATVPNGLTLYVVEVGKRMTAVFQDGNTVPAMFALCCVPASALLIIDYLLRKRNRDAQVRTSG